MKKLLGLALALSIILSPLVVPLTTAQASYSPNIEVEALTRSQFRITITNAPSYSQVDLYYHQSDSELWNSTWNIGDTDRNGRFTTTRTFNSFSPQLDWFWYAEVGGRNTPSISTNSRSNSNSNNTPTYRPNRPGRVYADTTFKTGALVLDSGTVYLIYRDQRIGFASERVFLDLGYQWSDVVYGNTSNLPYIYTVTNATYAHPWGSWVKSGSSIYFVHEDGLIPVSSESIFKNNGGESKLTVPMNYYDSQINKLSKMKNNDSRLE